MWTVKLKTTYKPEDMAKMCRVTASLDMSHCIVTGDIMECPFPSKWCREITPEMWREAMEDEDEVVKQPA